ncbi:MAG: hypothetical protein ACK4E0_12105 [Chitinophagaceae bacterium]
MKKLFIVLAVASLGFVACNNEGETKETVDSTANKIEEAVDNVADSAKNAIDSAAAKVDSAASAAIDSLKK